MPTNESTAVLKAAKLKREIRRRKAVLTPGVRESLAKAGDTGLTRSIAQLRGKGVQERIGMIGHAKTYLAAVLESAAKISADDEDVRKFVKHFTAKDPVFSNSDTGMCAVQFEAWLIDNNNEALLQLVETVAEPGKPDFLAIFQHKIKTETWEKIIEGTQKFVTLKVLVEAGQQSSTEHERSDVTIVQGLPVKGYDPADDDTASQTAGPLPIPEDEFKAIGDTEDSDTWCMREDGTIVTTEEVDDMTGGQEVMLVGRLDYATKTLAIDSSRRRIREQGESLTAKLQKKFPGFKIVVRESEDHTRFEWGDKDWQQTFTPYFEQAGLQPFYSTGATNRATGKDYQWIDEQNNRIKLAVRHRPQGTTALATYHDNKDHTTSFISNVTNMEDEAWHEPEQAFPQDRLEAFAQSQDLPFIQTLTNITSRYGTWYAQKDPDDDQKVNLVFGEPRKRFTLNHPIEEVQTLLTTIAETYPNLPEEFDAMAEQTLSEYAQDNGEQTEGYDEDRAKATEGAWRKATATESPNTRVISHKKLKNHLDALGMSIEDAKAGRLSAEYVKAKHTIGPVKDGSGRFFVTRMMETQVNERGEQTGEEGVNEGETEGGIETEDVVARGLGEDEPLIGRGYLRQLRSERITTRCILRANLEEKYTTSSFAHGVMFNHGHGVKRDKKKRLRLRQMSRLTTRVGKWREGSDTASQIEEASVEKLDLETGDEIKTYRNPSKQQLLSLTKRAGQFTNEGEIMRGLTDSNGDVVWWDAGDAIHLNVADALGLKQADGYPSRLAITHAGALEGNTDTESDDFGQKFIIWSPDYGKGLANKNLAKLGLKQEEEGGYETMVLEVSDTASQIEEVEHDKFWYHPGTGDMKHVEGDAMRHHSHVVSEDPTAFGIKEKTRDEYQKAQTSGQYNPELVRDAKNNGWVRAGVRDYGNGPQFDIDAATQEDVHAAAKHMEFTHGFPMRVNVTIGKRTSPDVNIGTQDDRKISRYLKTGIPFKTDAVDDDYDGDVAKLSESEAAQTILQQLGGKRFSLMTGAKGFIGGTDSLSFRIGRNDAGVNAVRIVLDASDTYTMTFLKARGTKISTVATKEGLHAGDLQKVFTSVTGMQTSLGTMGAKPANETADGFNRYTCPWCNGYNAVDGFRKFGAHQHTPGVAHCEDCGYQFPVGGPGEPIKMTEDYALAIAKMLTEWSEEDGEDAKPVEPYRGENRYKFVEKQAPPIGSPIVLFGQPVGYVENVTDREDKQYDVVVRPISDDGDRVLRDATNHGTDKSSFVESLLEDDADKLLEAVDTASLNENTLTTTQLVEGIATSRVGDKPVEPLKQQYDRWIRHGDSYSPSGPVVIEKNLGKFAFKAAVDMYGKPVFIRVRPQTDELYKFDNSVMEHVLTEIDKFWGLEADYKDFGFMYNRGILMYGPPGTGKTSIVHQVAEMIVERGDICFYARDIGALVACLGALREVEKDRKVVVILEDADEFLRYAEREFLQLLDGEQSVANVLYLATTNYLDRFPPRLLRPGRFDEHVYVPTPPLEGRLAYFKAKLSKKLSEADLDDVVQDLADRTEGMSFGHLRELLAAHYVLKQPLDKVIARLRKTAPIEDMRPTFGSEDGPSPAKYRREAEDSDTASLTEATFGDGMKSVMLTSGGWAGDSELTHTKYPGVTVKFKEGKIVIHGTDREMNEAILASLTEAAEPKHPKTMTASQINKELDKLDQKSSEHTDKMIAAGRGTELPTETMKKDDPLAQAFKANYSRRMDLRGEVESRYGKSISRLPTSKGFGPRESMNEDAGHKVLNLPIENRKPIMVYVNPTDGDRQAISKQFREKYPNAGSSGGPKARTTLDKKGNKYVWMSGDVVHPEVEDALKKHHGIEANQNMQTESVALMRALPKAMAVLASADETDETMTGNWTPDGEPDREKGYWGQSFTVNGKKYRFVAGKSDGDMWEVAFALDAGQNYKDSITRTGDAFAVFSAAVSLTKQFIQEEKPKHFTIQAKEPSRQSLYAKMASRLIDENYTMKRQTPSVFVFSRKEDGGVTQEDINGIPWGSVLPYDSLNESKMQIFTDDPELAKELVAWLHSKGILRKDDEETTRAESPQELMERTIPTDGLKRFSSRDEAKEFLNVTHNGHGQIYDAHGARLEGCRCGGGETVIVDETDEGDFDYDSDPDDPTERVSFDPETEWVTLHKQSGDTEIVEASAKDRGVPRNKTYVDYGHESSHKVDGWTWKHPKGLAAKSLNDPSAGYHLDLKDKTYAAFGRADHTTKELSVVHFSSMPAGHQKRMWKDLAKKYPGYKTAYHVSESDESIDERNMVPLSKEAGGGVVEIHHNPSPERLAELAKQTKHGHLRGLWNGKDHDWWDGAKAVHSAVASSMGRPLDLSKHMEVRKVNNKWEMRAHPDAPVFNKPYANAVDKTNEDVDEMSLSRIHKHSTSGKGFVILSSDRSERTTQENRAHRKELLTHLRSIGKGFTHVKGGYVEQTAGGPRAVYEHSIMVHNVDANEASALAKHAFEHHQQEAVLHVHPKNGAHLMYGQSGNKEHVGDKMTTQNLHSYFTQWHNHRFGFKMHDAPSQSLAASVGGEGDAPEWYFKVLWEYNTDIDVTSLLKEKDTRDIIAGAEIEYAGKPPKNAEDPDDEAAYEYGNKYFGVGHGDEFGDGAAETRSVSYYYDGSLHTSDVSDRGGDADTHGMAFTHEVANKYPKGRYELDTGRLSLSPASGGWNRPLPERTIKAVIKAINQFSKTENGIPVKYVMVIAPNPNESIEEVDSVTHALKSVAYKFIANNPNATKEDVVRHVKAKLPGTMRKHVHRALAHLEADGHVSKKMQGMGFKYTANESVMNEHKKKHKHHKGDKIPCPTCGRTAVFINSIRAVCPNGHETKPDVDAGPDTDGSPPPTGPGEGMDEVSPFRSAATQDTYHKQLKQNPDRYRQVVGKCPSGFHYGVNAHTCVPNRTVKSVARTIGRDVVAGVKKLGTASGAVAAVKHVAHTAKHLAKEVGSLAMLPVHVATGTYKIAFKPAVRKALVTKISTAVKREAGETGSMVKTLGKMLIRKTVSDEEKVAAINQAVDLVKVAAAGAIVGSWASGGLAHLAKELAMPYDDLAGVLVDKPLRALTNKYLGTGNVHGLLPSAFYQGGPDKHESIEEDTSDTASQILLALAGMAASHRPTKEEVKDALTGKVDAGKLAEFLSSADKAGYFASDGASESAVDYDLFYITDELAEEAGDGEGELDVEDLPTTADPGYVGEEMRVPSEYDGDPRLVAKALVQKWGTPSKAEQAVASAMTPIRKQLSPELFKRMGAVHAALMDMIAKRQPVAVEADDYQDDSVKGNRLHSDDALETEPEPIPTAKPLPRKIGQWVEVDGQHTFTAKSARVEAEVSNPDSDNAPGTLTTAAFKDLTEELLEENGFLRDRDTQFRHWRYPKIAVFTEATKLTLTGPRAMIKSVRRELFEGTPLAEDDAPDFTIKDVQQYFDMQILSDVPVDKATKMTKKKFDLDKLDVSPVLKVSSDEVPDPTTDPTTTFPDADGEADPEDPSNANNPPTPTANDQSTTPAPVSNDGGDAAS